MSSEHRNQGSGISDELLGKTWTELRWLWEAEHQARQAAEARAQVLSEALDKTTAEWADLKAAKEQAEAKLAGIIGEIKHINGIGWQPSGARQWRVEVYVKTARQAGSLGRKLAELSGCDNGG